MRQDPTLNSPLIEEFQHLLSINKLEKRYGIKPPQGEKAILSLYGDPRTYASPQKYWTQHGAFAHIPRGYDHIPFLHKHKGFWCHTLIKCVVEDTFQALEKEELSSLIISFDGCYNHRVIRGGKRLSMHAFGAAIDLNASMLSLGSKERFDSRIVDLFKTFGWAYGGDFKGRKDPMHFEFGSY